MEFELIISESFQKDMDEVIAYISLNLYNPVAFSRLLKNAEATVENIQCNPYMYSYSHIEAIDSFLDTLSARNREIFVMRYCYTESFSLMHNKKAADFNSTALCIKKISTILF